jgi:hypothetical protein
VFNIFWSSNDSISHYVVQLDENPSELVQNTSIALFSEASTDVNHTLYLGAVDMCGQISEALVTFLVIADAATMKTPTSPMTTSLPSQASTSLGISTDTCTVECFETVCTKSNWGVRSGGRGSRLKDCGVKKGSLIDACCKPRLVKCPFC